MPILIIFDSSSKIIRGSNVNMVDFLFSVNLVGKIITTESLSGKTSTRRWAANYQKSVDNVSTVIQLSPTTGNQLIFTSSNPSSISINASGTATVLTTGVSTLSATDPQLGALSATIGVNISYSNFGISDTTYTDPNCLGAKITQLMSNYLSNLTPSQYVNQYFTKWSTFNLDPLNTNIVDNPDFIAKDLDLSWVSVYRDDGTGRSINFPRHLISPRHVIMANHVQPGVGEKISFRTKAGAIQEVTVLQYSWIADDLGVAYLDADVVGIEPVLFPSESLFCYNLFDEVAFAYTNSVNTKAANLPGIGYVSAYDELPVFALLINQIPNAFTRTINGVPLNFSYSSPNPAAELQGGWRHLSALSLLGLSKNITTAPTGYPSGASVSFDKPSRVYRNFSCDIYDGDSSSPVFAPITVGSETKCLLITSLYSTSNGPNYSEHLLDIVDVMNKQAATHGDSRTYALNTVDLNSLGYRRYSQGYSDLSPAAKKVVQTFNKYGGSNGVVLSALRLNKEVHNQDDTPNIIYQMTGKKVAHIQWDYIDPYLNFFINQGVQAKALLDWASGIQALKDHWNAGGTVGLGVTYPNFVTGGDWFDRRRDIFTEVSFLKEENSSTQAFKDYRAALDRLADMLNTQLIAADGTKIPVVLRMYGETNGWYDYLPGEGLDPDFQLPGRVITSLSRQVGTSLYQITFAPRPLHSPGIPGIGNTMQVTGTSDSRWSGRYTPYQVVSGNLSTDPYNQPLTILAWKGGSNPSGSIDVSSGSAIAYPSSGSYYAGIDRAEDLMIVIRETLDYLRFKKGCTQIINSTCLFPELFWSTNEANKNALGQTFDYSNWMPDPNYVDMGGADYYTSTSSATTNKPGVISSLAKQRSLAGTTKPFVMHELGFNMSSDSNMHTGPANSQVNFWSTEVAAIKQNLPFLSSVGFWDHNYIPATTDAAFPDFVSTVNNGLITLDKLNRIN